MSLLLQPVGLYHSGTRVDSLGRRVRDELDALGDVTTEALVAGLEELLLLLVGAANDVDSLLGTAGTELNGYREVLSAGGLGNGVTTLDTGQVYIAGLDDALLALGGLDDLLGEAAYCRSVIS
jgi:hypothetical protein